jgi:PKD repeat protein
MTTTIHLTSSNCCGVDEYSQNISVYNVPVASFTTSSNQVSPGQALTFNNNSQYAFNFLWDFGDGSGTSTDQHPSYTFAQAGTYTVTLTASNPAAVDTIKQPIVVEYRIFLPLTTRGITSTASIAIPTGDWYIHAMVIVAPLISIGFVLVNPRRKR